MNVKLLCRIPQVVEILNISRSTVYDLLSSGTLRSVHINRTPVGAPRGLGPICRVPAHCR